jgi:hypothetical protein
MRRVNPIVDMSAAKFCQGLGQRFHVIAQHHFQGHLQHGDDTFGVPLKSRRPKHRFFTLFQSFSKSVHRNGTGGKLKDSGRTKRRT